MFVPLAELQPSLEVGKSAGGTVASSVQVEIASFLTVSLGSRVLLVFSRAQVGPEQTQGQHTEDLEPILGHISLQEGEEALPGHWLLMRAKTVR